MGLAFEKRSKILGVENATKIKLRANIKKTSNRKILIFTVLGRSGI